MLDSAVFRTMFGNDQMRQIMCDRAYISRLVQVEVALAKVEGDLGIVPVAAAEAIARYADADKINLERLRHEVCSVFNTSLLPYFNFETTLMRQTDRHSRLFDPSCCATASGDVRFFRQIHPCWIQYARHSRPGSVPTDERRTGFSRGTA